MTARTAIPMYTHPVADPGAWIALPAMAPTLSFVVVNVHDGAGAGPDPDYLAIVPSLLDAGVPLVGYVATDWGRRAIIDVVDELDRWRDWYGVGGIFFDEVALDPGSLGYYGLIARAARRRVGQVVLNPGQATPPGLAALADLTCTYEGPADAYRGRTVPPGRIDGGPGTAHLVYGASPAQRFDVIAAADEAAVDSLWVTDREGANPWAGLCTTDSTTVDPAAR
jgi:hypothetical protein